jgi:hypothetical protein
MKFFSFKCRVHSYEASYRKNTMQTALITSQANKNIETTATRPV